MFKTDIVILGAGIGGLETFRTLSRGLKRAGLKKDILIVDRNNYFTFVPLLHEVATGAVEPAHAAIPLRELVYQTPHQFLKADVKKILPTEKKVETTAGEIRYEYCVVALGSGANYYGIKGAAEQSFTIRTLAEAMNLRQAIINKIEGCDNTTAITVVGGGYTGVETAGQLADFINHDLKKLYPEDKVSLSLIQNMPALIPSLPAKAQRLATRRLKSLGVKIYLNSRVKEVREGTLVLEKETLPSDLTVWCAGNLNEMALCIDPAYCERGRMPVTHFLNHPMNASLYGVGDIIMGKNPGEDNPYPQLGEAAEKEGRFVGRHIVATMRGKSTKPFHFKSLGMLMPIGERYGLVILNSFVLSGFLAWVIRRGVYLFFMPGFTRKLKIAFDWALRAVGFRSIIDVERK